MKTTDGGVHWTPLALPEGVRCCSLLAIDPTTPSTVYAFTGGRVHKSVDHGGHWTPAGTFPWLGALAVAKSAPSTLYAASTAVWRSSDGGESWQEAGEGLPRDTSFWALAVDPTRAEIVYAATFDSKVFKSADGGAHWRQMPIPLETETMVVRFAIDAMTPSTVYAAYAGNWDPHPPGVLKSTDRGETWVPVFGLAAHSWVNSIAIDPTDPRRLYVATSGGVFVSTDGAASWVPLDGGLPTDSVLDVAIDGTGTILRAATTSGLFEYRFASPADDRATVVEYYHPRFDHYFMTSDADEIAKLDSGAFEGWTSTGLQFNAYSTSTNGVSPVCRFFSTGFAPKSSHFYSPFGAECTKVQDDPHWLLETDDAFDIAVPSAAGECPGELIPVYRLYNDGQGGAPNHRYTTDRNVRAQMIAKGWVPEGLGPEAVQMCAAQ
jgi:photosystem II stability/assembly factor-like uncharacterized protein